MSNDLIAEMIVGRKRRADRSPVIVSMLRPASPRTARLVNMQGHAIIAAMHRDLKTLALVFVVVAKPAQAAGPYTAPQAAAHVGESATVCGTIAAIGYSTGQGKPISLFFDGVFPNHLFSVRFLEADRGKLGDLGKDLNKLQRKQACATGTIASYRGKPEIVLTQGGQLSVK